MPFAKGNVSAGKRHAGPFERVRLAWRGNGTPANERRGAHTMSPILAIPVAIVATIIGAFALDHALRWLGDRVRP